MWRLELNARQYLCCGICIDVCPRAALRARTTTKRGLDGHRNPQHIFPFLATPDCNGCQRCVRECPAVALRVSDSYRQRVISLRGVIRP